mgnify:CR=1 FL=1
MPKEICEDCTANECRTHRCRANPNWCIEGEDCPDFIGEGNCACIECGDS